jgi:hypothetical protein
MVRTAIISVTASFLLFGAWAVNLVSYIRRLKSEFADPAQRSC